jgi:hypothetical protein
MKASYGIPPDGLMNKLPPQQRLSLPAGPAAAVTRQVNHWLNTSIVIQAALIVIFALPLVAHLINMLFTRPMADDYTLSVVALERGVFGALDYWYNQWTGTPTSIVGQSLVAVAGPVGNAVAAILMLLAWVICLVMSFRFIMRRVGFKHPGWMAWLLGLGSAWAVAAGIPNAYQSMYWTSGGVVYSGALVFLSLQILLITFALVRGLGGGSAWLAGAGAAVIAILIGGCTQTVAAMQFTAYALGIVGAFVLLKGKARQTALILLGGALIGAVLALVIALVAPGNAIRQSSFTGGSVVEVIGIALQNTAAFFAISLSAYSAVPLLLVILLTALTVHLFGPARAQPLPFKRVLLVIGMALVVGVLLVLSFVAPAAYGMGLMPAARAWIIPQFTLTMMAAVCGAVIGLNLRRSSAAAQVSGFVLAVMALLLAAGPLVNTLRTITDMRSLIVFAQEWDARDRALRESVAAGQLRGTVRPLVADMAWYAGLAPVGTDVLETEFAPSVAAYYGMTELILQDAP